MQRVANLTLCLLCRMKLEFPARIYGVDTPVSSSAAKLDLHTSEYTAYIYEICAKVRSRKLVNIYAIHCLQKR
ncbi:hypothetical protein ASE30_07115 [Achromobacter sp. Root83]|nr:hypothetical protein ASE30_07115 [Achromobacter sp. Root83]